MNAHPGCALLILLATAACSSRDAASKHGAAAADTAARDASSELRELSFETDEIGTPPKGWTAAETNGTGALAVWRVERPAAGASGLRIVRLAETKNAGATFNLLLSDALYPPDLEVQVKVHADSGKEDQGGGLVWRAKDANNYYVARWNPLEDNVRVYKVVDGKRTMLRSADHKFDPAQWHEIVITARGKSIHCRVDHALDLECEDDAFASGGKIGLWTKADAASSFDQLAVESWTRR